MENTPRLGGCEKCDFPSQCRYSVDSPPTDSMDSLTESVLSSVRSTESGSHGGPVACPGQSAEPSDFAENVTFDQILSTILSEDSAQMLDSYDLSGNRSNYQQEDVEETMSDGSRSAKRSCPSQDIMASFEEEIAQESAKLPKLVGLGVWECLEDVDLEQA